VYGALAAVMAWSMRTPDAGAGWRLLFVACSLALCALLWRWVAADRLGVRTILVGAVVLRLLFLPVPPSLSDDAYRYLWDGRVQTELGASPYAETPRALADSLPGDLFPRLNSPDYHSVYPPTSQHVFRAAAALSGGDTRLGWWVLKGVLVLVELAGLFALRGVLSRCGLLLLAWHPIVLAEIAGQAHTEALALGGIGVALWALARRPGLAGAALAAAGWGKLFPFALALPLVRRGGWRTVSGLAATAAILALPYASWESLANAGRSLALYAGTFDFYAAPYLALKALAYPMLGDAAGAGVGRLLGLVWVALVAALALTDDGSAQRLRTTVAATLGGYVLLSSTLHPWHLLPGLLALAFRPTLAWAHWGLALSAVTYLRYVGLDEAYPVALWLGWGGAAALALRSSRHGLLVPVMRRRAARKWARLAPHLAPLRPGARLLDLGCGEGFVGDAAARDLGAAVDLADVLDFNRTARPLRRFDGVHLPVPDRAYDATLLVYVLHHAADPDALLREARRVTRGPILILETVSLSPAHRRRLERVDRLANRLRSGGAMDATPPRIRSVEFWEASFERLGLRVATVERIGGFHAQAVFVVEGDRRDTCRRSS
jgi:SAM-dependent methyltransferase